MYGALSWVVGPIGVGMKNEDLCYMLTHIRQHLPGKRYLTTKQTMTQSVVISQALTLQCWDKEHTNSTAMVAEMQGPNCMRVHSQRLTTVTAQCPACQQ